MTAALSAGLAALCKDLADPSAQEIALYKYWNKLNHSLRITERLCYDKKKLSQHESYMERKPKIKLPDPLVIANKFCQNFSSIGPSLAAKIRPSQEKIKVKE